MAPPDGRRSRVECGGHSHSRGRALEAKSAPEETASGPLGPRPSDLERHHDFLRYRPEVVRRHAERFSTSAFQQGLIRHVRASQGLSMHQDAPTTRAA